MALSSKQVQKLGDRLRDGEAGPEELELLDTFRREFDAPLLLLSESICRSLRGARIPFLLSGRAKRTKSIIRKLRRPSNRHMDLSRMDDIVGIRAIVSTAEAQQHALSVVADAHKQVRDAFDYRDEAAGRYRAVHLVLGEPARRVEVQIRTCAQHQWADVCERFGERAKEGDPTDEESAYLRDLGQYCIDVDRGASVDHNPRFRDAMMLMQRRFLEETRRLGDGADRSYVVVYQIATNELIRCEPFDPTAEGRDEAICFYRDQASKLSEAEFDVLVLNSSSPGTLRVTHPRYFPE
ncbi:MAG: RelA/SpoT domain-containing protein [Piscinibacter sp.]